MTVGGNGNVGVGIATPTFAVGNGVHLADKLSNRFRG